MGGDGAFVRTADIRTVNDADVKKLFLRQSEQEFGILEKHIDALERKLQSVVKGTKGPATGDLAVQFAKIAKEVEDARKRDFFSSPTGDAASRRMQTLEAGLRGGGRTAGERSAAIPPRRARDYQGRTWATRKNPFVDRMASAWLIRRFIDAKAVFAFINEKELASIGRKAVAFDLHGGEFTHVGDLCTFEVLVRSFGIKDRSVRRVAEIVHDLDVKDDKYGKPETAGVEDILSGIRKTSRNDADALERGMAVFEMLYQSKNR